MQINKIRVALSLQGDGPQAAVFCDALGEASVGPQGLLSLLETRLGLAADDAPFSRRLIQYLECLEETCHPAAFYAASYQADPFSVARTLLQWRDQWYLAGWQGRFADNAPQRLLDMAAVELLAAGQVDFNTGQRIQRVIDLLDSDVIAIESIILQDRLVDFPALLQSLIAAIGAPVSEAAIVAPAAQPGSDLHALQRYLLDAQTSTLALKGDHSVFALRSGVASDTAVVLAAHASTLAGQGKQPALLAESRGALLDEALASLGEPRVGFHARSSARPLFQVLPLALELLWAPLDAGKLLQFLAQAKGPLPARARRRLARCVTQSPGVGSDRWCEVVAGTLADTETEKRGALSDAIRFWLEPQRYAVEAGAPFEVLSERTQRVLDWLLGSREQEADAATRNYYAVAISQAQEFIAALERLRAAGRAQLTRDNVLRLLDDVKGSGAALADHQAELRPGRATVLRAQHSGAFHQPVQEVIWWDCQASDRVGRWPWSAVERDALFAAGVELQTEEAQLDWLGQAWLRPILCASERCVLVLHDDVDRHHPIWDRLSANVSGLPEYQFDSVEARELLQLPFDDVSLQTLPAASRWWQLPAGTDIPARDTESYSSLSAYLYSPYEWLLRYPARIRPGMIEALSDGGRLRGNIVHRLIERFFAAHENIQRVDRAVATSWLDQQLPLLIEQEGATLLASGRQAECAEFIARVQEALQALLQHLQQAGVQSVQTECHARAPFCGGQLAGYIDLLARCELGEEIIVDVKWGGRRYQRTNLREGNYLQLAVYAYLRSESDGAARNANLSYFIASDAHMLNLDHKLFPNAEIVQSEACENWAKLWQRFETTWHWRNAQQAAGLFEVTALHIEPDQRSIPPEGALAVPDSSDSFSDYGVLTGWPENT
ncbi:MAG: PD-(D/E)XK nuclease family protein [Pseudomonadales bacterium]